MTILERYAELRETYQNALLLLRVGDFYELFFDDAVTASKTLGLTLTTRHKNDGVPICGFPYHTLAGYTKKLVAVGDSVAVCEPNSVAVFGPVMCEWVR